MKQGRQRFIWKADIYQTAQYYIPGDCNIWQIPMWKDSAILKQKHFTTPQWNIMTLLEGQINADLVTSTGKPSGYTRIGFTRTSLEQNWACNVYFKITHTHTHIYTHIHTHTHTHTHTDTYAVLVRLLFLRFPLTNLCNIWAPSISSLCHCNF